MGPRVGTRARRGLGAVAARAAHLIRCFPAAISQPLPGFVSHRHAGRFPLARLSPMLRSFYRGTSAYFALHRWKQRAVCLPTSSPGWQEFRRRSHSSRHWPG